MARWRWILRVIPAVGLALLSGLAGLSFTMWSSAPGLALALNPVNTEARFAVILAGLGDRVEAGKGPTDQSLEAAVDWLGALAPGDARVASLRGLVREQAGDEAGARTFYHAALARGPTEQMALRRLLALDIARGGTPEALGYFDVLMRRHGTLRDALAPLLVPFADAPQTSAALEATLRTDPPWRTWAIAQMVADPQGLDFVRRLFLAELGTPLETGSVARPDGPGLKALLGALVKTGRIVDAYGLYRAVAGADGAGADGYVSNPRFEGPRFAGPFDWALPRLKGAAAEIGNGSNGRSALVVRFADSPFSGDVVSQLIFLPPGRYSLSVSAARRGLTAPRGLALSLGCAGADPLASVDLRGSDTALFTATAPFVAAGQCLLHALTVTAGRHALLRKDAYGGELDIFEVRVERREQ